MGSLATSFEGGRTWSLRSVSTSTAMTRSGSPASRRKRTTSASIPVGHLADAADVHLEVTEHLVEQLLRLVAKRVRMERKTVKTSATRGT